MQALEAFPFDKDKARQTAPGLNQIIRHTITEAMTKMATSDIIRAVAGASGADARTVRRGIRTLVSTGEFRYTYIHGTSFLEKSFDRPVRVSGRIVIKPPERAYQPNAGEIVLNIASGAAFGNGDHPSTRLALKGLDAALGGGRFKERDTALRGLDIGTGSGILALALARLGMAEVVAIDIDPCAVCEATHNAEINGLSGRVSISNEPVEALAGSFSVIAANLAYPTLSRLAPLLSSKMDPDGVIVLSGFKAPASNDLAGAYRAMGLTLIREEKDRDWACLVFCNSG